jgi:hypothetical protein
MDQRSVGKWSAVHSPFARAMRNEIEAASCPGKRRESRAGLGFRTPERWKLTQ